MSHNHWHRDIAIYLLVDPRDGRVRYVGQTRDPATRLAKHKEDVWGGRRDWLLDMRSNGIAPRMVTIGAVPERLANLAERVVIAHYRAAGHPLLNAARWRPYVHPYRVGRCRGATAAGQPCRRMAMRTEPFCGAHRAPPVAQWVQP